jgi:hypothetical protein
MTIQGRDIQHPSSVTPWHKTLLKVVFGIAVSRDGSARKTPLVNFGQPEASFAEKRATKFELVTFTLATSASKTVSIFKIYT